MDQMWSPQHIKRLRQDIFRSTREFEERTGISCRTWQAFEQGRVKPTGVFLFLIDLWSANPELFRRLLLTMEGNEDIGKIEEAA